MSLCTFPTIIINTESDSDEKRRRIDIVPQLSGEIQSGVVENNPSVLHGVTQALIFSRVRFYCEQLFFNFRTLCTGCFTFGTTGLQFVLVFWFFGGRIGIVEFIFAFVGRMIGVERSWTGIWRRNGFCCHVEWGITKRGEKMEGKGKGSFF